MAEREELSRAVKTARSGAEFDVVLEKMSETQTRISVRDPATGEELDARGFGVQHLRLKPGFDAAAAQAQLDARIAWLVERADSKQRAVSIVAGLQVK